MKTLKQSWLEGDLGRDRNFLYGPIEQIARPYFTYWNEKEVRGCWRDFVKVLKEYISVSGKRNHTTSPLIIIAKNLFMLQHPELKSFTCFMTKWQHKFEVIKPPIIKHPKKPNSLVNAKVYLEHVLGALYMLDAAAKGNLNAVTDMYSLISEHQLHEIKLTLSHEQSIAQHCRNISKLSYPLLLDLFIYKIISDNPKLKHKQILSIITKSVGKKIKLDGYDPIIVIKEIHEKHLMWQDPNGNPHKATTTDPAFAKRVCKIRKKLP